jgi:hypothetical protein
MRLVSSRWTRHHGDCIDVAPLNGNAVLPDMPLAGCAAARALGAR